MFEAPRIHTKRPQTNPRLLRKLRMGLWSQPELEWLLSHLGPLLTPDIEIEIRSKLQALQTGKGGTNGDRSKA
jgi:hypothetical protein